MEKLENLKSRIISRVNINLRHLPVDVAPYFRDIVSLERLVKFYSFYGIWANHAIHFHFSHSSLAGTYFLGRCQVDNSILYKCDVRGDELKERGEVFKADGFEIQMEQDEMIRIKDSFLVKTLVHNFSHDPEEPELFYIENTVSAPYANIHGSPMEGCFLEPFCTVDLTTLQDCRVGTYSYLQVGELSHQEVESGKIWIRVKNVFDFSYVFPEDVLSKRYIAFQPGKGALGMFMNFVEDRKVDFQVLYDAFNLESPVKEVPSGASINRYSVWKGKNQIGRNVLVAQRAYLESSWLGEGANAQENCYIGYSRLEGFNVTAHGASIIYASLGKKVFVGFNCFLNGKADAKLEIGEGSIIMPHTIIDVTTPISIPDHHLVWGYIRNQDDLKEHSISLEKLSTVRGELNIGRMKFQGDGDAFVGAFRHRIEHILEANGAFFDGETGRGHAQKGQDISFNIMQPYPHGEMEGLFPTIDIKV